MFISRELKTFISVAEKMSVKLAAEDLNITSPAVCSMIKKFEQRINSKLFSFECNKMTLTPYGERIYALTKDHFHTLKSIEIAIKERNDVLKVFISEELLFLSQYIECQLSKESIRIALTTVIDNSTDIVITDTPNVASELHNHHTINTSLLFYIIHDKKDLFNDIFIIKDSFELLRKHFTVAEVEVEINKKLRVSSPSSMQSVIEMVISSLGAIILPHICPVLKCLQNSNFELTIKKTNTSIPLFIHVHKRIDSEIFRIIFENDEKRA